MGFKLSQSLRGIYRTRLDRYQQTAYFFIEGRFRSTSELSIIPPPFSWATGTTDTPASRRENCGQRSVKYI